MDRDRVGTDTGWPTMHGARKEGEVGLEAGGSRWIPRVGDPLETSEYSLDITIKLIISSTCPEYSTLHTVSMYYSGLVRQVPMIWFASFVHSSNHDPGRHEV